MLCPQLIGRHDEIDTLMARVDAAVGGQGSLSFVTGEAGVGKSRLLRELSARAAEGGVLTLGGRAVEQGARAPYRPLAEALISGIGLDPTAGRPELAGFRPALEQLAGMSGAGGVLDPLVLGEVATRVVDAAAAGRGAVLVLEDLHWADPETLAVVEYLADHLADVAIACVATVRSGEGSNAEQLATTLVGRRAAATIDLERLAPADVEEMLRACLGTDPPEALVPFVRDRSDGVPLVVEELLAGLVDDDALVRTDGGWRVVSRFAPRVPVTFAETVQRRAAHLGDDGLTVIRAAALLGDSFEWRILAGATGMPEDTVAHVLGRAEAAQLVEPVGSTQYRFRHALSRDAVVGAMTGVERARLASAVRQAVSATHPGLPGDWCALAADLAEAEGAPAEAVELLIESAQRAMSRGALASAAVDLDRASSILGASEPAPVALTEARAAVAGLSGDVEATRSLVAGMIDDPAVEPDRADRVRLVLARAEVAAGRWHEALAVLDGLSEVTPAGHALRAQAYMGDGSVGPAVEHARLATGADAAAADPAAACEALEVLGRAARLRSVDEAEGRFATALVIAEREGLALWRARALHELGTIDLFSNFRYERLEAAREAAVEAGAPAIAALVDLHLGAVATARWEWERALEPLGRCVDTSRRLGLSYLGMGLLHLAFALVNLDDEPEAEACVREALAVARDSPDVEAGVPGRVRFIAAVHRADLAGAMAALDAAVAVLREHPGLGFPFYGQWALLRALFNDHAEAAIAEAGRSSIQNGFTRACLRFADAVVAGRAGQGTAAGVAVEEARGELAAYEAVGCTRALGLRIVAEAALTDGWGEPEAWLREALAAFEGAGETALAASCRAALREAGLPVPRAGRGEGEVPAHLAALGVTSREVDVLGLLAQRLSNREIGARLHLSPRTVERHVANLLTKTGAANRVELAQLAQDGAGVDG